MRASSFLTIAVVVMVVATMPATALPQSQVSQGSAYSADQFTQIQLALSRTLSADQRYAFAYCVCAKDRGRIVYAYSLGESDGRNITGACAQAAANCGGCFSAPTVTYLYPAASSATARDNAARRFLEMYGGGDSAAPPKKVLPNFP